VRRNKQNQFQIRQFDDFPALERQDLLASKVAEALVSAILYQASKRPVQKL